MPVNVGGGVMGPSEGSRKRNTLANILSKYKVDYQNPGGAAALPALSPADTAQYYAQLSGLAAQYQQQQADLRAQRVGLRAGFRTARAGIRLEEKFGLGRAESQALERGGVGSSVDVAGRARVRAEAVGAVAGAKEQMFQSLAQNRIAEQRAGLGFFQASQQLEANRLAAQQQDLVRQLSQNLVVSGQESQMDVLRAIYEQLAGGATGALTPGVVRLPVGVGSRTRY